MEMTEEHVHDAMEEQQPGIHRSDAVDDVMQTAFVTDHPDARDVVDDLVEAEWQELMDTLESTRQVLAIYGISGGGEDSMFSPNWPSPTTCVRQAKLKQSERSACRELGPVLLFPTPATLDAWLKIPHSVEPSINALLQ